MYGYIYKTTNTFNNKIYIGQHRSNKFDHSYYGSGYRIRNLIKKYGTDSFVCELLEECDTEDILNQREIYWIAKYNATNPTIGYNLMPGGYRVRGACHSESTKQKISASKTGKHPNRDYTKITEETKSKISNTLKIYYMTHNNPRLGVQLSDETKDKLRKANLGKHYSDDVRNKRKGRPAWNRGIPMSEDAKQHLREINAGRVVKRRTVGQCDKEGNLLNTFISCADASRKTGVNRAHITACCLNTRKSAGGYMWKYLD